MSRKSKSGDAGDAGDEVSAPESGAPSKADKKAAKKAAKRSRGFVVRTVARPAFVGIVVLIAAGKFLPVAG